MTTLKINLHFELSAEQQMNVFAQWREQHPKEDLEKFTKARWRDAISDMLALHGSLVVAANLPDAVELKKLDYQAQLKGIAPAY